MIDFGVCGRSRPVHECLIEYSFSFKLYAMWLNKLNHAQLNLFNIFVFFLALITFNKYTHTLTNSTICLLHTERKQIKMYATINTKTNGIRGIIHIIILIN